MYEFSSQKLSTGRTVFPLFSCTAAVNGIVPLGGSLCFTSYMGLALHPQYTATIQDHTPHEHQFASGTLMWYSQDMDFQDMVHFLVTAS